jgi:hypothetical protein
MTTSENDGVARSSSSHPVGETERQRAVDALCEAFADDRIPVVEFERRVDVAHRAETLGELRALLADLPAPSPPAVRDKDKRERPPVPALWEASRHPTLPPEAVRETSVIAGILGGGTRRGAWRPARVNYAVGVLGGFELDFRDAPLPPGVTEVRVLAVMGGGEIIVPPDVVVEVSAVGIMGGFEEQHDVASTEDPDAPIIRVTGFAMMGGASIVVRYPGETSRDAKRRRRLEKKERRRLGKGR